MEEGWIRGWEQKGGWGKGLGGEKGGETGQDISFLKSGGKKILHFSLQRKHSVFVFLSLVYA